MASIDLSLDEIIKKKKIGLKPNKPGFKKFGGNNVSNNRVNTTNNALRRPRSAPQRQSGQPTGARVGVQSAQRPGAPNTVRPKPIGDARNKIIQKKRQQLTDARDKLCELAKRTDARQKLEKLRQMRSGNDGAYTYNGLNVGARKPLRSALKGNFRQPDLLTGGVSLQRTISQPISRYPSKVPSLMDLDLELSDGYMAQASLPLRRTVNNDQMRRDPLLRPSKLSNISPYSWKAPQHAAPSNSSRGYIDLDYPAEEKKRMKLPSPPPMRPIIVSDDEDMVEPVRPTVRSSRIPPSSSVSVSAAKMRIESSRVQPSAPSSSSGYRIVVSNLQNSVTHEDIRELFEDIGPLVTSRLVRPGTAEVVYRHFKHAEAAVENYHNRQLDGQPMKCLLVKPRPSTSSSSASPSIGNLRAPLGSAAKLSGSGKSSVVPDISAIHKALFNKS